MQTIKDDTMTLDKWLGDRAGYCLEGARKAINSGPLTRSRCWSAERAALDQMFQAVGFSSLFHATRRDQLTDAENAHVIRVWNALPGWTCWASAFDAIKLFGKD